MSGPAAVMESEGTWLTQATLFSIGLFLASHTVSNLIFYYVYTIKPQIRQVLPWGETLLCPEITLSSIS